MSRGIKGMGGYSKPSDTAELTFIREEPSIGAPTDATGTFNMKTGKPEEIRKMIMSVDKLVDIAQEKKHGLFATDSV